MEIIILIKDENGVFKEMKTQKERELVYKKMFLNFKVEDFEIRDFLNNEKLIYSEMQGLKELMKNKVYLSEVSFIDLIKLRNIGKKRAKSLILRMANYGKN